MSPVLIQPIIALLAGILILVDPAVLNYVVAIYLIVIGIMGLVPSFRR
jgi:threonine/homoserine efflux transporter RhtA